MKELGSYVKVDVAPQRSGTFKGAIHTRFADTEPQKESPFVVGQDCCIRVNSHRIVPELRHDGSLEIKEQYLVRTWTTEAGTVTYLSTCAYRRGVSKQGTPMKN